MQGLTSRLCRNEFQLITAQLSENTFQRLRLSLPLRKAVFSNKTDSPQRMWKGTFPLERIMVY